MKKILSEVDRIATESPQQVGKLFEPVAKRILEAAPEFRSQFRKIWLWDEYPDYGGADRGIDLRVAPSR